LVVAHPVLTSAAEGPSTGTLFFARYLDAARVTRLSDSVRLSITLSNYDNPDLSADFQAAKAAFADEVTEIIRPRDDTTVSGYALLRDVYGDPAVILRAEMPRAIYGQGWNTITYFVVALVIVGFVFGASNLGLLERFVLSRVAELNTGVSNIRSSGDPTARVSVSGSDELAELANAINGMIESLAESQKRVWASERELQTVVNNVPVTLWALDKQGEIMLLRGKGLEAFGFQRVSASAQLDTGVFRNVRPMIEHSRNALLKGEESGVILTTGNRVFDTRYSPLRDEKDGIIGVIGIATDITEQKQAADALEFALGRVEKQNREIERVHEFYRATLEQVISTVKLGASRVELLSYLHEVQSEFDHLQDQQPKQPEI
jgi:PAS domain-containing protein